MSSNNSTESIEKQNESPSEAANPVLDQFMREPRNRYLKIAVDVSGTVNQKQLAYGDAFGESHKILSVLFPDGVQPDQYKELLAITRVIDKLFRLANQPEAFGENPWADIAGYAILSIDNRSFKDGK